MSKEKIYAIKRKDGGVSIATLKKGVDPAKVVEQWEKSFAGEAVSYRVLKKSQIPSDTTFRDAWTDDFEGEKIDVDMAKAREVQMSRIREKRNIKFTKLGFPFRLDPKVEDKIVDAETKKLLRALRDIPKSFAATIEKASTPAKLKDLWPDELKDV